MNTTDTTTTRPLAERIASALLTPHGGPEGTRLAIKLERTDGTEGDLGGNCKRSIIEVVNRHLGAYADERAELIAKLRELVNVVMHPKCNADARAMIAREATQLLARLNP